MIRLALLVPLALTGCASSPDRVRIESAFGDTTLDVALVGQARTAIERAEGLRAYAPLGDDDGLLIRFPIEGEVCITNAEVDYAIDLVFFVLEAERYRVNAIASMEANQVEAICLMASDVLEVRAGVADQVAPGQRATLP